MNHSCRFGWGTGTDAKVYPSSFYLQRKLNNAIDGSVTDSRENQSIEKLVVRLNLWCYRADAQYRADALEN